MRLLQIILTLTIKTTKVNLININFYDRKDAEESHSGYCTSLENWNPSQGSWVRVPLPPHKKDPN